MSVEKMLPRKGDPGLSVDLSGALYPRTLMKLVDPLMSKPLKNRANNPSPLSRKDLVDMASDKSWSWALAGNLQTKRVQGSLHRSYVAGP